MKAIPSISDTFRAIFYGVIFLLVLGVFTPQHVEARMEFQRAMPITDGDPDGGLDYNGGGSGASDFTPPEEGPSNFTHPIPIWLLGGLHIILGDYSGPNFGFSPYFNGQPMPWTILYFDAKIQGGQN